MDALRLLQRLNPPVRPMAARAGDRPIAPFESRGFDDLLAIVASGEAASGRSVTASAADQQSPLTPEQLERLAAAADAAEGAGFHRALVLLDGRALVLDTPSREITEELRGSDTARAVDVDGAVHAPKASTGEPAGHRLGPAFGPMPEFIARQIDRGRAGAAAPSRTRITNH
jgi:hypothetical protein